MKITIVAVGRARKGSERTTYEHYTKRIRWPLTLREIPENRGTRTDRSRKNDALERAVPEGAIVVALDERGDSLTSMQFAQHLGRWRDDGVAELAFLIGGADGLDAKVRAAAQLVLSFGRVTWPHLLMRALLAEQIYRAQQILDGHTYHRA